MFGENQATCVVDDITQDSWLGCPVGHSINCEMANPTQTPAPERGRSPDPGACGISFGAGAVVAQRGCQKAETNTYHHG